MEFKIQIKTEADRRALEAYKAGLKTVAEETRKAGGDAKDLEAKLAEVDKALQADAKSAKKAGEGKRKLAKEQKKVNNAAERALERLPILGRVYETLKDPAVGAALAIGGIAASVSSLLRAAAEQEKSTRATSAALAQQGDLSEQTAAQVRGLASSMQELTGIADTEFENVITKLLRFGSTADTLAKDMEAVEALAGLMGGGEGSLASAGLLVAKVLQGNTGALSEYGIMADQTLPKLEQITDVLNQIKTAGGGALRANLDTLDGQFGQIKNSAGDLKEALGETISNAVGLKEQAGLVADTMAGWADIISRVNQALGLSTDSTEGLTNSLLREKETLAQAAEAAERHAEALNSIQASARNAADDLARMNAEAERQLSHETQLLNTEERTALARVGERDDLSNLQRAQAEQMIRQRFERRRRELQLNRRREAAEAAGDTITSAQTDLQQRETEAARAQATLRAVQERDRLESVVKNLQEELDRTIVEQVGRLPSGISGDLTMQDITRGGVNPSFATRDEAIARRESIERQLEQLLPNLAAARRNVPDGAPAQDVARREANEASQRLSDAQAANEDLMMRADRERTQHLNELRRLEERYSAEDRLRDIEARQANRQALERDVSPAVRGEGVGGAASRTAIQNAGRQVLDAQHSAANAFLEVLAQQQAQLRRQANQIAALTEQVRNSRE